MSIAGKLLNTKVILILIILLSVFLRLYKLTSAPPSLFGDELDLGYQALSILKTGHDYQGNFMPLNFHSMAEWRTPLYLYSAVPTVAMFGITPLGVRLPAAIFGILDVVIVFLLFKEILSYKQPSTNKHWRSLLAAFLMAISPWSLQYSRAGFEVTEMLFFLMLGHWLFFKSLKDSKFLWLSVVCFVLTPWIYSTAKLFTPILLIFLFIVFKKEILKFPIRYNLYALLAGLIVGLPLVYGIFFGGGSQRFNYISIFSDPKMENSIGIARNVSPGFMGKIVNNKFTYWGNEFVTNYLSAFSTNFLFIKGDLNLRQSIGTGELFRLEVIPLIIGLAYFFLDKNRSQKIKLLMGFWILIGVVPSALTIDGGNHATRLILILPALIFFVSFGWVAIYNTLHQNYKKVFLLGISLLYVVSFLFYLHEYYGPYILSSEHWWHYGWGQGISKIKSIDNSYSRVFISMSGEPAWIFFAGYYEYPPTLWQKNFPVGNDVELSGFGKISHTGKFYFGSPDPKVQVYGLGQYLTSKDLYLANAGEIGNNLILHPEGTPPGLKIIDTVIFPTGEPAFYLFTGTAK